MELSEAISERRSVRHFNNKEVSLETIKDILNYGILSPSAHNRQPWHFVVINKDKDLKNNIADILETKTDVTTKMTCNVIRECSSLILVYADLTEELMDTISVGACIENIVLRARDLEIGTLWIGYILQIEEELKELFKTDKKLMSAIALGYTDKFPSNRPRKKLDEVSEWY